MLGSIKPNIAITHQIARLWNEDPAKIYALNVLALNHAFLKDGKGRLVLRIFIGEEHVQDHVEVLQEMGLVGSDRIVLPHAQNALHHFFGLQALIDEPRTSPKQSLLLSPSSVLKDHLRRVRDALPEAKKIQQTAITMDYSPLWPPQPSPPEMHNENAHGLPFGVDPSVAQQLVQVFFTNSQYILLLMRADQTEYYFHGSTKAVAKLVDKMRAPDVSRGVQELKKRGLLNQQNKTSPTIAFILSCAFEVKADLPANHADRKLMPEGTRHMQNVTELVTKPWFALLIKQRTDGGQPPPPMIQDPSRGPR